jgi:hypothetical protein
MKNFLFALLFGAGLFVGTSAVPVQAGEEKILICHVPPGNPDNLQTIEIGVSARATHEAHGDWGPGLGCHF